MNKLKTLLLTTLIAITSIIFATDTRLKLASGFIGGTYNQVCTTLGDLPSLKFQVMATKGSNENINLIASGDADIGMAQLDVFEDMLTADPSLASKVKILLPVFREEVHILTNKKLKKARDLKGLRISIGASGSGTQATTKKVLDVLNIDASNSVFDESTTHNGLDKLKAGNIDAIFIVAGAPLPLIKEISEANIKLVPIRGKTSRELRRSSFSYKKAKISKKTYSWVKRNTRTIGVDSALLVRASLADWQAEDIIKKIFTNHVELFMSHEKWKELDVKTIMKLIDKKPELFHKAAVTTITAMQSVD